MGRSMTPGRASSTRRWQPTSLSSWAIALDIVFQELGGKIPEGEVVPGIAGLRAPAMKLETFFGACDVAPQSGCSLNFVLAPFFRRDDGH